MIFGGEKRGKRKEQTLKMLFLVLPKPTFSLYSLFFSPCENTDILDSFKCCAPACFFLKKQF